MNTERQIQWTATRTEMALIARIAARATKLAKGYEYQTALMDLEACHCNGCPLALELLLEADDGNLMHDVFGIRRHIDRETGKLGDCFSPRYSAVYHTPVTT